ncbi:MAG TPA: NAD(P)/FAD-dependent oxidoreductase [Myxococcota bacterium]|nr:NAD(P)/FAD-dependent oxidoreductase [Myxococcota bacterium]
MRFHTEARRDAYDAIVVGGGMGGLTAAALLAKSGRSVLVVERHDRPGGYAHAFRRGPVRFDSAVHLVGGCGPGGLVDRVLRGLGVRGACDFARVDPFYTSSFPGLALRVPGGVEEFVEAHAEGFPTEEKRIRELLQICLDVWQDAEHAPDVDLGTDLPSFRRRHPSLVRFHRATLDAVLRTQVRDPRLAAAFATLWPYVGLPPSRLSFVYWSTMLASYLVEGAWYCRGTFQTLARALVQALEGSGGELLLRSTVRRIRVRDGRARGVVLENGQRIDAPVVVSNADARQTFDELVGRDALPPRFAARLAHMRPSVSAFVVYASGRFDPRAAGLEHENFVWSGFDHDAHAAAAAAGRIEWLTITVPTLADPALAPAGQHAFVLTTLLPYDAVASWRDEKERLTEALLARAERAAPGLRAGISFAEAATPRTLERYTRNGDGAIYGWEHSPEQVGLGRLALRSPVEGLVLAGHWTRPGGGIYGVVMSGVEAARAIVCRDAEARVAPARG